MRKEPQFFIDHKTGTVLEAVYSSKPVPSPDQLTLSTLIPNTSDGASEKHLPVIEISGTHVTVKVGSTFHPMTPEHSIDWVMLQTEAGCCQRVCLDPDCEPVVHFTIEQGDSPVAAYAYCNLHGFWKTTV